VKVLVCGSRGWNNDRIMREVLGYMAEYMSLLIHGDAPGADRKAAEWCEKHGNCECLAVPADWEKHGKNAGFLRNLEMLDMLDSRYDTVVAFWDGESRGTKHTIENARNRGIVTMVVTA